MELDSPEDKLPSFSKRALQLGMKGLNPGDPSTLAAHTKNHTSPGDMQNIDQAWVADQAIGTQRRDGYPHLVRHNLDPAMGFFARMQRPPRSSSFTAVFTRIFLADLWYEEHGFE